MRREGCVNVRFTCPCRHDWVLGIVELRNALFEVLELGIVLCRERSTGARHCLDPYACICPL